MRRLLLVAVLLAVDGAAHPIRVVIIDIDGVRRDTFEQAYAEGRLRNLERILGSVTNPVPFASALVFENATTVFPTVTMAAQASMFTGVYPSQHGIPGNSWFDTAASQPIDYMTPASMSCVYGFSILMPNCDSGLANRHLMSPTIYEMAGRSGKSSTVVFSQYYKGATMPVLPSIMDALTFVRGANQIDYAAFDARMIERAIQSLASGQLPEILTVYFAGADGVAHERGIASELDYFSSTIDPLFGRLLDAIAAWDSRWAMNTLFIITSDHGRTDAQIHPEDLHLADDISAVLMSAAATTAQLARNGGMAYIYAQDADAIRVARALAAEASLQSAMDCVLVRQNGYRLMQPNGDLADVPPNRRDLIAGMDGARAGNIVILLKQGHYFGNDGHGSDHGNIAREDLNVPLILANPSIAAFRSTAAVSNTQIAATIAAVLNITAEGIGPPLPGVSFRHPRGHLN